jgi:hypothetical protein
MTPSWFRQSQRKGNLDAEEGETEYSLCLSTTVQICVCWFAATTTAATADIAAVVNEQHSAFTVVPATCCSFAT